MSNNFIGIPVGTAFQSLQKCPTCRLMCWPFFNELFGTSYNTLLKAKNDVSAMETYKSFGCRNYMGA